jgi:hypothetical protein
VGTPQLVIADGATNDSLWRATLPGLAFVEINPAPAVGKPIAAAVSDGEGTWVATYDLFAPNTHAAVSTDDGATWAVVNTGLPLYGQPIWDGRQFVVPTQTFEAATSPDGLAWALSPMLPHIIGTFGFAYFLWLVGDHWVAVDASSPQRVHISDGVELDGGWTPHVFSMAAPARIVAADDDDLVLIQSAGGAPSWYEPSSLAGAPTLCTLVGGSGDNPQTMAHGSDGGDWIAGASAAGDYWTSPDGKTWTRHTEAAIAGWTLRHPVWDRDSQAWWFAGTDGGGNVALFEFDPAGPTWTENDDLPDVGQASNMLADLPSYRRYPVGPLDVAVGPLAPFTFGAVDIAQQVLPAWAFGVHDLAVDLVTVGGDIQPLDLAIEHPDPVGVSFPGTENVITGRVVPPVEDLPPKPTPRGLPLEPWLHEGQHR